MGKQNARLYFSGADHKDIYYQGNYHDKMYIGSQLVWEKLTAEIEWEGYASSIGAQGYVRYNGSYFLLVDSNGNLYRSSDAINWSYYDSPYPSYAILQRSGFCVAGSTFVCRKRFSYGASNYSYQLAKSEDGLAWVPINHAEAIRTGGTVIEYDISDADGFVPYFNSVFYINGKYFSNNVGRINDPGLSWSLDLMNWIEIPIDITALIDVEYASGYYYFAVQTSNGYSLIRSSDLINFSTLLEPSQIRKVEKFSDGIIVAIQESSTITSLYYSENGVDFERFGSAGSWNVDIYSIESNQENIVDVSYPYEINIYTDLATKMKIYRNDVILVPAGASIQSIVLANDKIYVFYAQSGRITTIIGTIQEEE